MSVEEILKMIETVSPDDTVKLDEIDARVQCFLHPCRPDWIGYEDGMAVVTSPHGGKIRLIKAKEYTRSRDALKAIRPEGWDFIDVSGGFNHNAWTCQINMGPFTTEKQTLPTEELAELHAIIQAIAYEKKP